MTLSPTRAAMAAAEDAAGAFAADGETAAVVVSESSPPESASASASSSSSAEEDEPEIVEISYEDVAVGAAPDIAAAKAKIQDREEKGLTEMEQKAIDNNLKIKQYNNAPVDFPTFVREGYDVRVITPPGFVTQEDGLVYKDFQLGTGELPKDGQEVTFDYIAYNENGGTIDSTYRKNAPASTRLGINGMIPGFEEGLKGMREGGKRRVVVPPELGPPVGPATFFSSKQWEVFDIELIKIKNCERVQTGFMVSSVVCE
jgi:FKBP-type peptidyl-prolyl cis-trans isomerase